MFTDTADDDEMASRVPRVPRCHKCQQTKYQEIIGNCFAFSRAFSFVILRWAILHPKFYADYECTHHIQKIFTNFEYTVSSEKAQFALLIQ